MFGTGRRSQNEGHPSVRVATPWHVAGGSHPPVRQSCPREVYLSATSVAASPTWAETRNWGLRLPSAGAGNRHGQAVDSVVARLCQAGKFDYDGAPVIAFRTQAKTSPKDLHNFVSSAGQRKQVKHSSRYTRLFPQRFALHWQGHCARRFASARIHFSVLG